jgi:hypothetical protein
MKPRLSTERTPLVLVWALAAYSAGCAGIDPKKLASKIEEKFESEGLKVKDVECPKSVEVKEGDKFECEGKTSRGDRFVVKVKQQGGGEVSWELQGRIVDAAEIAANIKQKSEGADIECESGKFIAVAGTTLACTHSGRKLTVTFTNDEGSLKWE